MMLKSMMMNIVVYCLFALCCLYGGVLTASASFTINKRNQHGFSLSTFKLRRIRQERTSSGYTVSLHLEGSTLPTAYVFPNEKHQEAFALEVRQDGVARFSVSAGDSGEWTSTVLLALAHPYGYHSLQIRLTEDSVLEQIVPDTDLFIRGGPDVTFQRGHDVDVNVTRTTDSGQVWIDASYLQFHMIAKSPSEEDVVVKYWAGDTFPFHIVEDRKSSTEREEYAVVRINTSSGNAEGLLVATAYTSFYCRQGCLVQNYYIFQDIPVRRDDHDGPFQRHFLGSLRREFEDSTSLTRKKCFVNAREPCYLQCIFVGNHPHPVQFIRADCDAETTVYNEINIGGIYFQAIGTLVFRDVTLSDAGVYRCKSRSGPVDIVRNITLTVIHAAKIIEYLSSVTIFRNGTAKATCQAEGSPAPTIVFLDADSNELNDVSSDAYDLVQVPIDNTNSKAVLRTRGPVDANRWRLICQAYNIVNGQRYDSSRTLVP